MPLTEITGYVAAFLTTSAFLPQAIKVVKTRNTEGISLWMYIIFTLGVACWLIYGLIIQVLPIIIANAITLIQSIIILYLKIIETQKN